MNTKKGKGKTTSSIKTAVNWLAEEVGVNISSSQKLRDKLQTICNSKRVKKYTLPNSGNVVAILKAIAEHISYGSLWADEIVSAANHTPPTKENHCLEWVVNVINRAVPGAGGAFNAEGALQSFMRLNADGFIHNDRNIPTGAIVYGSGAGKAGFKWGHIGVCVNGSDRSGAIIIADSVGGKVCRNTLDVWIAQQEWSPQYKGYALVEEVTGRRP
jgi:hypothetical protein